MSRRRARLSLAVCLLAIGLPFHAGAQSPYPQTSSALPQLQKARDAITAGRFDAAVGLADGVLKSFPNNRDAAAVKIAALVGKDDVNAAFSTYETWIQSSRREDVTLLEPIARAELNRLRLTPLPVVQGGAMEALAASGDVDARAALESAFRSSTPTMLTWDATEALARLGDAAAERRVLDATQKAVGGARIRALHALKTLPQLSNQYADILRSALGGDVMLQVAVADVAGALNVTALVPDLKRALPAADPFARLWMAATLKRLGDTGGDELLRGALAGPAVDVKLIAAQALKTAKQPAWKDAIRPLLDAPESLNRLYAAELFVEEDRERALTVLKKGLEDPNHVIRGEAARILTSVNAKDVWVLRWMLRDGAPMVRFLAAKTVLAQCVPAKA